MVITIKPAYDDLAAVGTLFEEYIASLIARDAAVADVLAAQAYEDERRHLMEIYGPPAGRLYLALVDGEAAGCIALRKLDDARCEVKRLYVRPAFRGQGLGRRLAAQVIAEAQAIGYRAMLLDSLPFLDAAIALYRRLGFYDVPPYYESPMAGMCYMQLDL